MDRRPLDNNKSVFVIKSVIGDKDAIGYSALAHPLILPHNE